MLHDEIVKLLKKDVEFFLKEKNEEDILNFLFETQKFTLHYVASCELPGEIYLVLDNSVIQEIKHRKEKTNRAVKAEAYLTFCKFVKHWSDRITYLTISPMAVYEHLGRKIPTTIIEIHNTLTELNRILSATSLEIRYLNFRNAETLYPLLISISQDEAELTKYVKNIDQSSWKTDLSAPIGVKIPMSVAFNSLPPLPPLEYFHPWYVHFVLSGRVEKYIIEQSRHNPKAMPIGSGELTILFSKLNTFKRQVLQGLGDIDIFQICDVCQQFQNNSESFFIGQTLDRDLHEVLTKRHILHASSEVIIGGAPDQEEKISNLVNFMFSNPFKENEIRARQIHSKFVDFKKNIDDICLKILESL